MKYIYIVLMLTAGIGTWAAATDNRSPLLNKGVSAGACAADPNGLLIDTVFVARYVDSLLTYERNMDSLPMLYPKPQTLSAYDRYMLFAPVTFYYSVAAEELGYRRDNGGDGQTDDAERAAVSALLHLYLHAPHLVALTESELRYAGEVNENIDSPIRHDIELAGRTEELLEEIVDEEIIVVVTKPKFWTCSGEYYMQFLQNYISSNWYKGGESSYSMVASAIMQANYNNLKGVKFDNKLEMKLGFQTSKSDSLHSLKTSEDLLRYTGKVGIQATGRWYYALQLIAYTQFMRGYKSNDEAVYSDFMSPFNANLSLGMDYNVEALNKKLTGTIQLAPLAYNFKYVGITELAETYGLDEGEHALHDIGSGITVDLTWQFHENAKWTTRLYGYTTYHRSELEWENTLTFQFGKYISSNLFIYPRFDDSTTRDDKHGYWQFKEYASFGISYSF